MLHRPLYAEKMPFLKSILAGFLLLFMGTGCDNDPPATQLPDLSTRFAGSYYYKTAMGSLGPLNPSVSYLVVARRGENILGLGFYDRERAWAAAENAGDFLLHNIKVTDENTLAIDEETTIYQADGATASVRVRGKGELQITPGTSEQRISLDLTFTTHDGQPYATPLTVSFRKSFGPLSRPVDSEQEWLDGIFRHSQSTRYGNSYHRSFQFVSKNGETMEAEFMVENRSPTGTVFKKTYLLKNIVTDNSSSFFFDEVIDGQRVQAYGALFRPNDGLGVLLIMPNFASETHIDKGRTELLAALRYVM